MVMRDQPVEDLNFVKPELEHGVRVVLQRVPHVPAPGTLCNIQLLPPHRYLRYRDKAGNSLWYYLQKADTPVPHIPLVPAAVQCHHAL